MIASQVMIASHVMIASQFMIALQVIEILLSAHFLLFYHTIDRKTMKTFKLTCLQGNHNFVEDES